MERVNETTVRFTELEQDAHDRVEELLDKGWSQRRLAVEQVRLVPEFKEIVHEGFWVYLAD